MRFFLVFFFSIHQMSYFPVYVVIIIGLGLFGDADQQCCDLPMLADVVPSRMRGYAYSLIDMVQCFFAFLATVVVGKSLGASAVVGRCVVLR